MMAESMHARIPDARVIPIRALTILKTTSSRKMHT